MALDISSLRPRIAELCRPHQVHQLDLVVCSAVRHDAGLAASVRALLDRLNLDATGDTP